MSMLNKENSIFILLSAIGLAVFYSPLFTLFSTASGNELYSHALIVPFVSGYVLYNERKDIFAGSSMQSLAGAVLILAALAVFAVAHAIGLAHNDFLSAAILSAVVFWIGAFVLCYGHSAKKAVFPLAFLLLAVPVPEALMEEAVFFLQTGSTEVASMFFNITGAPIVRDGFFFHLPGLNVEVARECSGIRSSIALVITGIIASRMFLVTGWRRLVLIMSVIPLAMIKNGLRITVLTLAGYYIDESALSGPLHNRGGILFFLTALAVFAGVLWALKRGEKKSSSAAMEGFTGQKKPGSLA